MESDTVQYPSDGNPSTMSDTSPSSSKTTTDTGPGSAMGATEERTDNLILKLPPEIRNMVYELALIKTSEHSHVDRCISVWRRTECVQPSLTRVCKAIRTETLPVFYSQNLFHIAMSLRSHERESNDWAEAIGALNRSYLRQLCVSFLHVQRHDLVKGGPVGPLRQKLEEMPTPGLVWNRSFQHSIYACDGLELEF